MGRLGTIAEIWAFMKERKKWWLAPIVILLILLLLLIIFAETTALGPFIYPFI
jgi:uncharacterized integral membrane protein